VQRLDVHQQPGEARDGRDRGERTLVVAPGALVPGPVARAQRDHGGRDRQHAEPARADPHGPVVEERVADVGERKQQGRPDRTADRHRQRDGEDEAAGLRQGLEFRARRGPSLEQTPDQPGLAEVRADERHVDGEGPACHGIADEQAAGEPEQDGPAQVAGRDEPDARDHAGRRPEHGQPALEQREPEGSGEQAERHGDRRGPGRAAMDQTLCSAEPAA
jgi:hypothetical protein